MRVHDLRPAEGAKHRIKRVGRGNASGTGKTSGRGQKGTGARKNTPPGFEGGNMPLQRRLPKLGGFTPRNRIEYAEVNVSRLDAAFDAGAVVDLDALRAAGLVRKKGLPVKVLGNGELTKKLTVKAARYTASAKQKIEQAGGSAEVI